MMEKSRPFIVTSTYLFTDISACQDLEADLQEVVEKKAKDREENNSPIEY